MPKTIEQLRIDECATLQQLCDVMRELQEQHQHGKGLEFVIDICDLPNFGPAPIDTLGIWSWDDTDGLYYDVDGDRGWYIDERADLDFHNAAPFPAGTATSDRYLERVAEEARGAQSHDLAVVVAECVAEYCPNSPLTNYAQAAIAELERRFPALNPDGKPAV